MNNFNHMNSKPKKILLSFLSIVGLSANANMLSNPGFEDIIATNLGNNIGASIRPWVIGVGNQPNVVKVNGNPYAGGPDYDANPTTNTFGTAQQYLDVANGSNDFYQTFTVPTCGILPSGQTRTVDFSGWFSGRLQGSGTGIISIIEGADPAIGSVLGTVSVDVPTDATRLTTWFEASGSVDVATGSPISYVVSMPDNLNFDEASMTFSSVNGVCPTAKLTLVTQWVDAVVGDAATFSATGISGTVGALGDLSSTADSSSDSDSTTATPIYIADGDVIDLSSLQSTANSIGYTTALSCTGAASLVGNVINVNATGDSVECTLILTRTRVSVGESRAIPTLSWYGLLLLMTGVFFALLANRYRKM